MSAPRPTQFIALRRVAAASRHQQCRGLHMTGPEGLPSHLLRSERSGSMFPQDIAGLRAECRARNLDNGGSKHDLMARLRADDITSSRGFVTATALRPTPRDAAASSSSNDGQVTRQFNTSRTLKRVGDSSPIDFAYMPDFDPDNGQPPAYAPMLKTSPAAEDTGVARMEQAAATKVSDDYSTPSVSSPVLNGTTFSHMQDVHDNTSVPIDFHAVADRVTSATSNAVHQTSNVLSEGTEKVMSGAQDVMNSADAKDGGFIKQLWKGLSNNGSQKSQTA